jgi:hypothetical protein
MRKVGTRIPYTGVLLFLEISWLKEKAFSANGEI